MPEMTRFSLNLTRATSSLHQQPHDDIRRHLTRLLAAEAGTTGTVAPTLHYIVPGGHETAVIAPGQRGPEYQRMIAASFRSIGARPEVFHRFRAGELVVTIEGSMRRCAALLEHLPTPDAPDAWWLTYCLFGLGELGVGVLHGDWITAEGSALEELDEPFRTWLDEGSATVELTNVGQTSPSSPIVHMRAGGFPPNAPVPFDATSLAAMFGELIDVEYKERHPTSIRAFVLAGHTWESWDLQTVTDEEADEVIRFVAKQAGAYGVVVVWPAALATPTGPCRGWVALAEAGDERVLRATAMRAAPGGQVVYEGPFYEQPPDQAMVWLGVPPRDEVGLGEALGFVDRSGKPVSLPEA